MRCCSAHARPCLVAYLSLGSIALGIEKKENAVDNIIETTQASPDLKPAPDPLFGASESLGDLCDMASLWRMVQAGEVNFFNLPLLEQVHHRPYHLVKLRGSFDLARLVQDYRTRLLRSESYQTAKDKTHVERLMLSLGEGVFAVYDAPELLIYAPTTEAAAQAAEQMKRYRKPEDERPGFRLVSLTAGQPTAQLVTVEQAGPINERDLALHYGSDFLAWEQKWIERLRQRRSGVSILFGPPGCGKTSYLRGLMSRLIGKFEFYYIPVSAFDVLSSPSFVAFWIEQKGDGRGRHRIAILEDSEELLQPRDEGSQTKVSNLLNIGDGFLGEHLNLHVIATTNSPMRQLDPALLRPGRLMGAREFRRLTRTEAQQLAQAKGLALPDQDDFSLAELYCGAVINPAFNADRQIGFAR
jgi:hypothetical protein